ncbi:MAG: twin-arginine translocase subunit TatC, partial [Candidatus Eisenbacteria bacterium]|nr:twin-arginine translocase subunit TatC [Candidatus Eisenbacteria bacterium]
SAAKQKSASGEMALWDHLDELRAVLLRAALAIIVGASLVYATSAWILEFLVSHTVGQAQFLSPMEGFGVRIKISLLLGLIISLPVVLYQIWAFIVPGLLKKERRLVTPMVIASTGLFLVGVAFASILLTPTMVKFLLGFATDHIVANLSISYLLDFFIKMSLACGVLFQLPLVVALLSLTEIITPRFLISKWRHAVVIILIVSAILTPSDAASQLALGAPVILLYFVSIFISKMIWKQKLKSRLPDEPGGEE